MCLPLFPSNDFFLLSNDIFRLFILNRTGSAPFGSSRGPRGSETTSSSSAILMTSTGTNKVTQWRSVRGPLFFLIFCWYLKQLTIFSTITMLFHDAIEKKKQEKKKTKRRGSGKWKEKDNRELKISYCYCKGGEEFYQIEMFNLKKKLLLNLN